MKQVRAFGVLLVVLLGIVLVPAMPVSAEPMVAEGGKVKVAARVIGTHYIMVDASAKIIQIDSNTTREARVRVFLYTVMAGNEQPLSNEVLRQYRLIIPTGRTEVGTVYTRTNTVSIPLFGPRKITTTLP